MRILNKTRKTTVILPFVSRTPDFAALPAIPKYRR